MSVIQQIQDKYAKLMAIIIAVALMIFVVMLAFENGGRLFGGDTTTLAKVNGERIDYTDYLRQVELQEKNLKDRGMADNSTANQQAMEMTWNDEVNRILEKEELAKLGIAVGKKELGDLLYGPNAPDELKKLFTDSTGIYNGQLAKTQIDALVRSKPKTADQALQREQIINYINYQERARGTEKLNALLYGSVNFPKWFVEKQIAENSQMAKISLVRATYAENDKDTTLKVTDKEIEDYVSKHKDAYKQEESRSIQYVAFSTTPSAADTAEARSRVLAFRPAFDTVKNVEQYLLAQGVTTFSDAYYKGSVIQIPVKDSIFKLPINGVYGPYLDGGSFTLARLLGIRQEPEMVKVRHILISTAQRDPQNPQQMVPVRDSVVARKLVDSIQGAIAGGANFDTLCTKFSEDPGKFDQAGKYKGGIYDSVKSGNMVAEFNEFIFSKPVGAKGVAKTMFGYHYIEILAHEGGSSPAYKVAYLPKAIEVSRETEDNAANEAQRFASTSRDQKSFDTTAEKLKEKGINKAVAQDIQPAAYFVGGLGSSRSLVKKIYEADKGDVLEPEKVGDNYVVAIVTEVNEKGTASVARARQMGVEVILKNKKIAEKIRQKIGNVTSLDAAATTLGKTVEVVDSLRFRGPQTNAAANNIVGESRVLGAAFNPANQGKIIVVDGQSGVYVVKVEAQTATAVASANVGEERKLRNNQGMQSKRYVSPVQSLREAADIVDRRNKFF